MNKQITEDYCNFEIAKLLKEKGFDWQQSPFYSEQDIDEWRQQCNYTIPNINYNPDIPFDSETITIVAPHVSQSLALKWLREVHNIHISVQPDYSTKTNYQLSWCWSVYILHKDCFECKKHQSYIDTFEQAVEAAIFYVLKKFDLI